MHALHCLFHRTWQIKSSVRRKRRSPTVASSTPTCRTTGAATTSSRSTRYPCHFRSVHVLLRAYCTNFCDFYATLLQRHQTFSYRRFLCLVSHWAADVERLLQTVIAAGIICWWRHLLTKPTRIIDIIAAIFSLPFLLLWGFMWFICNQRFVAWWRDLWCDVIAVLTDVGR